MKMRRACTPRRRNGHAVYHASGWESSEFAPFSVAFPHADVEWERQRHRQVPVQEIADVLDARVLEHVVPVPVIVLREDLAHGPLHVPEVQDHPALRGALNRYVNLVRVAVEQAALFVARSEVAR